MLKIKPNCILFLLLFALSCNSSNKKNATLKPTYAKELNIIAQKEIEANPAKTIKYCEKAIDTGNDYEKIDAWLLLGEALDKTNKIVEAINAFESALELSEGIDYKEKMAESEYRLSIALFKSAKYDKCKLTANEALQKFLLLNMEKRLADTHNLLGLVFEVQHQSDSSLHYYLKALAIHETIKNVEGMAKVQNNLGSLYSRMSEFDQSNYFFNQAIKTKLILKDSVGAAKSMSNIALNYEKKGRHNEALDYLTQALTILVTTNDFLAIGNCYNAIGSFYKGLEQENNALENYEKALNYYRKTGNKSVIAANLNNIGLVAMEQKKDKEALNYFNQSIDIKEQIGNKTGKASSLANIGTLHLGKENYKKALAYFNEALNLQKQAEDNYGFVQTLASIAYTDLKQKNTDKAILGFNQALDTAIKIKANELMVKIILQLSEAYEIQGNYKAALNYFQYSTSVKDSLVTLNAKSAVISKDLSLNLINKNEEIKEVTANNEQLINQRKRLIFLLGITLLICLGCISILIVQYKKHIKGVELLDSKIIDLKNQLEQKNETMS